jgi:hypothetical protein
MKSSILAAICSVLLYLPAQAVPVVLYEDLTGATLADGPQVIPIQSVAMNFTTGASAVTLTQIEAYMGFRTGGNSAGTGLTVALYSDASGLPGASITTLTLTTLLTDALTSVNLASFTPSASTALAASTTYWIVATASAGTAYGWLYSDTPGPWAIRRQGNPAWSLTSGVDLLTLRVTADDGLPGAPELSANLHGFVAMGLLLGLGRTRRGNRPARHQESSRAVLPH